MWLLLKLLLLFIWSSDIRLIYENKRINYLIWIQHQIASTAIHDLHVNICIYTKPGSSFFFDEEESLFYSIIWFKTISRSKDIKEVKQWFVLTSILWSVLRTFLNILELIIIFPAGLITSDNHFRQQIFFNVPVGFHCC